MNTVLKGMSVVLTLLLAGGEGVLEVQNTFMAPTLGAGDQVVVEEAGTLAVDDIVYAEFSEGTFSAFSRVVGLPGDDLVIKSEGKYVYRNGELVDQPYVAAANTETISRSDRTYLYQNPDNGDCSYTFLGSVTDSPLTIGDTVSLIGTQVFVNGQEVFADDDRFASILWSNGQYHVHLEADTYWLMGDNRTTAFDSRKMGVVSHAAIQGKATSKNPPSLTTK